MLISMFYRDPRLAILTALVRALVLITALPIHEYAHAWAAYKLGDHTSSGRGRLKFNPLAHLDPFGSFCLIFFGFGWAKPVPINPFYFKNRKRDMALTALAGPVSNILFALVTMILYKGLNIILGITGFASLTFFNLLLRILWIIITTNISLAVFNLIPIPPLDGSKIFNAIMPEQIYFQIMQYERYIGFFLMVALFTGILNGPIGFLRDIIYVVLDKATFFLDII